jgi:hypothetical protein
VLGSRGDFYLEPSAAHRRDGIIVFGRVRAAPHGAPVTRGVVAETIHASGRADA